MVEPSYTVLVVDDSAVNRETTSLYLAHQGYRVETASDGAEALRLLEAKPVDLILLDIMMPGLNGLEVLSALRERHPAGELAVIMATSQGRSEDMIKAFDLGANDYVTKPLDMAVVLARIEVQLRLKVPAAERRIPPAEAAAIEPGLVLEGKYRLESLIGHGNFGSVYRAIHLQLDRPVAVKLLKTSMEEDDDTLKRFQREGISACQIQHPNAVTVTDFSVSVTGIPFLVMELLDGRSLEAELKLQGRFTPERCAEILLPVCEVLAEAHALGIIHRDVKPQNVFLHHGRLGEVIKVLDFGIAKLMDTTALEKNLTLEGGYPGTPAYMAPERFTDEPYDGRVDVYSVGVMLYEMLVGELPFAVADGNILNVIRMHLTKPPRLLRELRGDLPEEVEAVVLRALAKKAEDRPTAERLAADFAAVVRLTAAAESSGRADRGGPGEGNP